jgi:hypothetical protein
MYILSTKNIAIKTTGYTAKKRLLLEKYVNFVAKLPDTRRSSSDDDKILTSAATLLLRHVGVGQKNK